MTTNRAGEQGSVTLFVLGICVGCLFLAGCSIDLWRAVAVRRELSAMADAAATAGSVRRRSPRVRASMALG